MIDSGLTPDVTGRRRQVEGGSRRPRPMVFRMRSGAGADPSHRGPEIHRDSAALAIAPAIFLGSLLVFLVRAPGLEYFLTNRDHGYQLCLGGQILLDRTPGVDSITWYGPMTMYTSALGLWASGSLVGETVLCATGYAACLTLLYLLVAANGSRAAGAAAAGVGYLVLARFYKWYIWLIPLATLWSLRGWLAAPLGLKPRRLAECGLVVGLSWLYRPDMGTLEYAAIVLLIGVLEIGRPPFRFGRSITTFTLATAAFPLAWLAYLAVAVTPAAPLEYLRTTVESSLALSRGMALPLPPIFSVVFGYGAALGILAVSIAAGLYLVWKGDEPLRGRFLLASGLVGASIFHQAMHRMDPQHLLQVIPPVIVAGFACLDLLGRTFLKSSGSPRRRWAWGSLGVAYGGVFATAVAGMALWARLDLAPVTMRPDRRFQELARPLAQGDAYPAVRAVQFVRENTTRADSVLVFPLDCQLLALAERRLSGRLHSYYPNVLNEPAQSAANLEAIQADAPALVVLPSNVAPAPPAWPSDAFARYARSTHSYLDEYIKAEYPRVVFDDGQTKILAR